MWGGHSTVPSAMDFSSPGLSSISTNHTMTNGQVKYIRDPLGGRLRGGGGGMEIMSDIGSEGFVLEQVSTIDFSPVPSHLSPGKDSLHGLEHYSNSTLHNQYHHHHHHKQPQQNQLDGFKLGVDFNDKGFDMGQGGASLQHPRYITTGTSPMPPGGSSQPQTINQTDLNQFTTDFPPSQLQMRRTVSSQLASPLSPPSSLSPVSPQNPMDMSVSSSTATGSDNERRTPTSPKVDQEKEQRSGGGGGGHTPSKNLTSRPHVLPPCRVCGAPATGFHYGANTCEACKGFFRRSLLRKEEYTCLKSIKCQIRPGKRNLCAACRYQRCLTAGMSKEGIKTGRYTYEKRTRDILELKQIHTEEAQQRVLSHQEELQERFKDLIAQVVRAQERNHAESLKTGSMISDIHNDYLEKKKQDIFAIPDESNKPVSHAVFMKVYQSTGIEMDDRRNVMESWIGTAERGLKQMVNFAKDLPDFKALSLADQIVLIKNSIAEAWVISRHKAFNTEHGCYTAHNGFTFDIQKAFDKDMVEAMYVIVRRLQKLDLTFEEMCILKATAFFFSDRCQLKEPEKVDKVLFELIDTLDYLVRKNHPGKSHMLAHLILVMADLRNITEMYHKQNEKVLCWTNVKKAPLIWEIMSYSSSMESAQECSASSHSSAERRKSSSSQSSESNYREMSHEKKPKEG